MHMVGCGEILFHLFYLVFRKVMAVLVGSISHTSNCYQYRLNQEPHNVGTVVEATKLLVICCPCTTKVRKSSENRAPQEAWTSETMWSYKKRQ
jgi:hypothetical protein